MLEEIMDLALENGLRPQLNDELQVQDARGRMRSAARIEFLPAIGHRLAEDMPPYLLELPLHLAFQGQTAQLLGFLKAMQDGDNFFPVVRFSVSAAPSVRDDDTNLHIGISRLDIELQCSAFFVMPDPDGTTTRQPVREERPILPPGA